MAEQKQEGLYQVTYTNPEGEIERVQFYNPCTLEYAETNSPNFKKWGLKKSVRQVDGAVLSALLDLSGMGSCKPSDADVYFVVIDKAVSKESREKVIDLTKPRPRVKAIVQAHRSQVRRSP